MPFASGTCGHLVQPPEVGDVVCYKDSFLGLFGRGQAPIEVTVDADFPTKDGKTQLYTKAKDGELWPLIIEKAYAKLDGGYERLGKGGSPCTIWQALDDTGLILPDDVPDGHDPQWILPRIAEISYLTPTKSVAVRSSASYDATPLVRRLSDGSADAVRLLPMRIPANRRAVSAPARLEGGDLCQDPLANPMTPLSQLSLLM